MIKVYNTLKGRKEEFIPHEKDTVKMYICGLTVQNYSHVGHIRSAVCYDVIRRYLEYKGYDVNFVINFTDINEKIVRRAKEEELTPRELADKYTKAYIEDIEALNIKRADAYCTATANLDKMIEMVEELIERGYAYEVNGNVYFSVQDFPDYGKLSGRKLDEMEAGARIGVNEEKKHPMDFALWKKVEDQQPAWDSPWSKGWPGWHIECSAMSMKLLGEKIDIHGGGTDLIFPHHENEIAQSEACTGQEPFAKYWLHNGTVNIKGEKMSKSLGNFFTTKELLKKFKADEIRYFLLSKHYHSPLSFDLEEIENNAQSYNKIINTRSDLENILNQVPKKIDDSFSFQKYFDMIKNLKQEFQQAMDDDFNTAQAIGVIHQLIGEVNSLINSSDFNLSEESSFVLKKAYDLLNEMLTVLGFAVVDKQESSKQNDQVYNQIVDYVLKLREQAREDKNFDLADKIRDDLSEMGFKIKDTAHGPVWSLKSGEENGS